MNEKEYEKTVRKKLMQERNERTVRRNWMRNTLVIRGNNWKNNMTGRRERLEICEEERMVVRNMRIGENG